MEGPQCRLAGETDQVRLGCGTAGSAGRGLQRMAHPVIHTAEVRGQIRRVAGRHT